SWPAIAATAGGGQRRRPVAPAALHDLGAGVLGASHGAVPVAPVHARGARPELPYGTSVRPDCTDGDVLGRSSSKRARATSRFSGSNPSIPTTPPSWNRTSNTKTSSNSPPSASVPNE